MALIEVDIVDIVDVMDEKRIGKKVDITIYYKLRTSAGVKRRRKTIKVNLVTTKLKTILFGDTYKKAEELFGKHIMTHGENYVVTGYRIPFEQL